VDGLRRRFGLEPGPVKVIDPGQMLGLLPRMVRKLDLLPGYIFFWPNGSASGDILNGTIRSNLIWTGLMYHLYAPVLLRVIMRSSV
jgi:hypothetical protein